MKIAPDIAANLKYPLSEVSRKERRNLLFAGTTGFLVSFAGIVPTKISAFGIELSTLDQKTFILLVAVVVFYFLIAFAVYGTSDLFIWRKKYQDYLEEVEKYVDGWTEEDQRLYDGLYSRLPKIDWLYDRFKDVTTCRMLFEFLLPVVYGIVAIVALGHVLWIR
ncbi:MAG: hypothetical protein U5R46_15285 [Gammaproteobacteria bacterium]|nr:hypothetical protein [Gammaproteobacteria bacterium]